ncbi:hypothetical protein D9M69_562350 [compost metagenome]
MPAGSIHSQHIASRASPSSSTPLEALALAMRAARVPSLSVSSVTAKSSRSRVIADAPMKVSQTTQYTEASSTQ